MEKVSGARPRSGKPSRLTSCNSGIPRKSIALRSFIWMFPSPPKVDRRNHRNRGRPLNASGAIETILNSGNMLKSSHSQLSAHSPHLTSAVPTTCQRQSWHRATSWPTHAVQLPAVLARHAAPAARLCAMVPVRDQEHTRTFLRGLLHSRAEVRTATVTPRWVEAVVAVQQGKAPVQSMRATAPFCADDAIKEGSILFVEATFPIDPSVSILEPPPSLRSEPAAADPCIDDDDEGFLVVN